MSGRLAAGLFERLHGGDPYEGFPLEAWPEDLQGWGSTHPVLAQCIRAIRPAVIVEVGTWKGASAIHMADVCDALGLDTTIVCVDTWLGSPEHLLKRDRPEMWPSLRMRHGYPQLYFQFAANVVHRGHQRRIVPLPQTSDNAAVVLRRLVREVDVVYVDAAHEHDPVLQDLRSYWPMVREGGVLIGDDHKHPPVAAAAERFAAEEGVVLHGDQRKFAMFRGPRPDGVTLPPLSAGHAVEPA